MAHISLEEQLKKLLQNKSITSLKLGSNETVGSTLKSQAKLFISILKDEINKLVYSHPESSWYERTGDLLNSIDENVVVDPATNTITVSFIDDLAWHESAITKHGNSNYKKLAYVPMAVIEGYEVFNTGHMISGIDFLERAIDRFNNEKINGITVKVEGKEKLMGNWWK